MTEPVKPTDPILRAIKESVLRREGARAKSSNYFILEEVLPRHQRLPIPRQVVHTDRPTIMVFADDAPRFHWGHTCRYLLHDAETGELYREVLAQFPPYGGERKAPESYRVFHQPIPFAPRTIYPLPPPQNLRPRAPGRRYAILFSGLSEYTDVNDLEFLYRTLVNVYRYDPSDITVLNYNGTLNYDGPPPKGKWPGDTTDYQMTIKGPGTKAALLCALDNLKTRLNPDDSLLIHTNNHGGHGDTESDLCCYANFDEFLGVTDFAAQLAELPPFRCLTVMMEQCYAGGFSQAVVPNSQADSISFASACEEWKISVAGNHGFSPFAQSWIAALAGADPHGYKLTPGADTNHDGEVSAQEAFTYAKNNKDPGDSPIYCQKNPGESCSLGQALIRWCVPPLSVEPILRQFWPEPDPLFSQRIQAILPQIKALEQEMECTGRQLYETYTKQLTEIIKEAGKL
jgi:hypothetical protein